MLKSRTMNWVCFRKHYSSGTPCRTLGGERDAGVSPQSEADIPTGIAKTCDESISTGRWELQPQIYCWGVLLNLQEHWEL